MAPVLTLRSECKQVAIAARLAMSESPVARAIRFVVRGKG